MYFILTGPCEVKVIDPNGREQYIIDEEKKRLAIESGTYEADKKYHKELTKGGHFGEISLLYETHRTATVLSTNYMTFARLIRPRYIDVVSEFPEYEKCLKDHIIANYRDKKIQYILRMLKRVEYLSKIDEEVLYEIMFNLELEQYESETEIMNDKPPTISLTFIESGMVDVYTKFDG